MNDAQLAEALGMTREFLTDALALADERARYLLWHYTKTPQEAPQGVWYTTQPTLPHWQESIDCAIRYLDARGMLERDGELVRVKT